MFQNFYNMVSTQFQKSIKFRHSGLWGEYRSTEFNSNLAEKGILHKKSCPHTPQQNGIAERKNRHLLEIVRTPPC